MSIFLVQSDLSSFNLELLRPLLGLVLKVSSQGLRGQTLQIVLDEVILLRLDLAASLASWEGSVLHAILKLNGLSVRPGNIIAEAIPIRLELSIDVVRQLVLCYLGLDQAVDFALRCISLLLAFWTVVIVEGQHVVVGPSVHLNREDRCLERQCLEAHLLDPWCEVEAVNWWHSVVLLAGFELVVVLSWRIQAEKHGLGAEDGGVIPRGLDVQLRDVVQFVHEGVAAGLRPLLLDIPVAELVSDHVLLADTEWSDVVCELGLVFLGSRQIHERLGSVGALRTDLVHVSDVLARAGCIRVCVGGLGRDGG